MIVKMKLKIIAEIETKKKNPKITKKEDQKPSLLKEKKPYKQQKLIKLPKKQKMENYNLLKKPPLLLKKPNITMICK